MNIFVLDDDLEIRISWFQEAYKDHTLVYALDAVTALDILNKRKFDLIFLDHDLGGGFMQDSDYHNTGYQVAKGLLQTINAETNVIIHSWNPDGAKRMADVLYEREKGRVLRQPFGRFSADIWMVF
jgi:predicted O-methyltransferase YrrM